MDDNQKKELEKKRIENMKNWDEEDFQFYNNIFTQLREPVDTDPVPGESSDNDAINAHQRFLKKIEELKKK
jgi:hypothetical protein